MKRIGKWVLIAFALVVGALAVLFFVKPETFVVAAIILAMLLNPGPPPIAEGQITSSDWRKSTEINHKLTAVLERRFPNGTSETDLESVLTKQGFRPVPPPPADCWPPGKIEPIGVLHYTCLTADQEAKLKRTLKYSWGDGVCGEDVWISWSVDGDRAITSVEGRYNMACL
jgi:hypothetical protein